MKNFRQTLLTILCVVGLAFVFSTVWSQAQSQDAAAKRRGPFMLAAGDKLMVWRIDQSTGDVSYCMRDTQSTDYKYILTRAPYCSAWSK